jgi:hypothetical protein
MNSLAMNPATNPATVAGIGPFLGPLWPDSRGQPNIDIKAKRETVAGRMPQKAKAAFQWNTASELLPRLVDELRPSVAHSIACSNSGAEARSGGEGKS